MSIPICDLAFLAAVQDQETPITSFRSRIGTWKGLSIFNLIEVRAWKLVRFRRRIGHDDTQFSDESCLHAK